MSQRGGGSRARQRREERERQRRQQRVITIGVSVAVVVVVLFALILISNQPADAPIPDDILDRYDGFIQTTTEDGFPVLGNPNAPVSVVEYSSFSCPGCASFHETQFDDMVLRARRGEINFTFVPLQTGGIPNANGAARTALCAGQQGRFWEMHDILFNWQVQFANNAFTQNRLLAGAEALNLNMDEFNQCLTSSEINQVLDTAQLQGVNATPTVRVNGTTVPTTGLAQAINEFGPFNNLPPGIVTEEPTSEPTTTNTPTEEVTDEPTEVPTDEAPTVVEPTEEVTDEPAEAPTDEAPVVVEPTEEMTDEPTETPTDEAPVVVEPTEEVTDEPTEAPVVVEPTEEMTDEPAETPTDEAPVVVEPTEEVTDEPAETPTDEAPVVVEPTEEMTDEPAETPTEEAPVVVEPTEEVTDEPAETPTDEAPLVVEPTEEMTDEPTEAPTEEAPVVVEPTEEVTDEPTETPTQEPTTEPTTEPADEAMAVPTLLDLVTTDDRFSTLAAAIEATGLQSVFNTPVEFTVFAPTNEAFEALLAELGVTADDLLADTGLLVDVLMYHVVDGVVMAEDVVALDGENVQPLLQRAVISVEVTDDGVVLNQTVNVVETDIQASNGVVHVIDAVLLPPPAVVEETGDEPDVPVVEVTQEPADEATPEATDEAIQTQEGLEVVEEPVEMTAEATQAAEPVTAPTIEPEATDDVVVVTLEPLDEATPEATEPAQAPTDEPTDEPTTEEPTDEAMDTANMTLLDVVTTDERFSTLAAAIEAAGLQNVFNTPVEFTVFAPTNEAFDTLLAALDVTADELLSDTPLLIDVLLFHVVDGAVLAEDVVALDGETVQPLLERAVIGVTVTDEGVVLNETVTITETDITTSNGVIHVIDGVLLPPPAETTSDE